MKTVKIASKVSGVKIKSNHPRFQYMFNKADSPLEVKESHADKILKNSTFYISDKEIPKKPKKVVHKASKQEKSWLQTLIEVKGIGKKTAEDIVNVYPTKGELLRAIKDKKKLPFRDDISLLIEKRFIN